MRWCDTHSRYCDDPECDVMRKPYPRRAPRECEVWADYFWSGFCPGCLRRLPYECTFPPDFAEETECQTCGVVWLEEAPCS